MNNAVDVQGERNRVAGRDLIEVNLAPESKDDLLVKAQRDALRGLVSSIADECNQSARHLWVTVVHVAVGVTTVGEIRSSQYQDAVDALERFRENFYEQRRREQLRVRLEQLAQGKRASEELNRFCLSVLGDAHLYDMPSEKLKDAVAHMEVYRQQRQERLQEAKATGLQSEGMPINTLIRTYPIHCLILAGVGFLFGLMF